MPARLIPKSSLRDRHHERQVVQQLQWCSSAMWFVRVSAGHHPQAVRPPFDAGHRGAPGGVRTRLAFMASTLSARGCQQALTDHGCRPSTSGQASTRTVAAGALRTGALCRVDLKDEEIVVSNTDTGEGAAA